MDCGWFLHQWCYEADTNSDLGFWLGPLESGKCAWRGKVVVMRVSAGRSVTGYCAHSISRSTVVQSGWMPGLRRSGSAGSWLRSPRACPPHARPARRHCSPSPASVRHTLITQALILVTYKYMS